MSGAGSPNCRPGSVQLNLKEIYETANWSLQQGDEEVNKRIEQKMYIFKQIAQYFGLKTNLLQGLNCGVLLNRVTQ